VGRGWTGVEMGDGTMGRNWKTLVSRAREEVKASRRLRAEGREADAEASMTRAGDLYERAGMVETAHAIFRGEIN
jgi:hypothetical protein